MKLIYLYWERLCILSNLRTPQILSRSKRYRKMNNITKSAKNDKYKYIRYSVILSLIAIFLFAGLWSEPTRFWVKTITLGIFIFLTLITDMVVGGHQQKDRFLRWFITAVIFSNYARYVDQRWLYVITLVLFIPGLYWFYLIWKDRRLDISATKK